MFQKERSDKKNIRLRYKDAVRVTFADQTTVSSDLLDVFVEAGKEAKRVVFTGRVAMNRQNQKVFADEAEIFVPEKRCELRGHVKVEQVKGRPFSPRRGSGLGHR